MPLLLLNQSNCAINGTNFGIDDDGATDQSGNSIASFFAPLRLLLSEPLQQLTEEGYVQFTIRFYVENGTAGQQYPDDLLLFLRVVYLTGLNYIHYDIDGSTVGTG